MNRPVHFEIHVTDPARAQAFYEQVFGWKFKKWNGPVDYWIVDTGEGPGIDGGLMPTRDGQPRTVNTVQVVSVDETAKKVVAAGGQIVVPKMAIPGIGWLAYCSDPTGALIGFMHEDPSAQ